MENRYAGSLEGILDIVLLQQMMEEMANAPKEEYGKRTAGERGMYEIQRLENLSRNIPEISVSNF